MKKIRRKTPIEFIDVNQEDILNNKSSIQAEDFSFIHKNRIKKFNFINEINFAFISLIFIFLAGYQIHQSSQNSPLQNLSQQESNNHIVSIPNETPYLLPNEVDTYLAEIKEDTNLIRETLKKYNPDDTNIQNLKLNSKDIQEKYQKILNSANINHDFNYYTKEQQIEILNTLKFIVDNYDIIP